MKKSIFLPIALILSFNSGAIKADEVDSVKNATEIKKTEEPSKITVSFEIINKEKCDDATWNKLVEMTNNLINLYKESDKNPQNETEKEELRQEKNNLLKKTGEFLVDCKNMVESSNGIFGNILIGLN